MLKVLRNKKLAKRIWIGLAIIIVPAFVLWGLGGAIRSKQESAYAGKIFGKAVTMLEYRDAVNAVRVAAIMQFGDKFGEVEKFLDFKSQAWERLIILGEAKKQRIKAGDREVTDLIQSYPFFQNKGRFDQKIYAQMLRYVFMAQPRAFEEQARQNIMISKLYKLVTDKISVSDDEIKQEYKKLNEEISLFYIAGIPSDFAKNINLSEEEIKDYYGKNSLEFKQPVSFNLSYLAVDSEQKARDIIARLDKKASLSDIAKESGLTLKETGLFSQNDPVPGIGWSPEVSNMISNLKVGAVTPAIQSDKQYFILKLNEKKESYVPELEKIKDKVKEALVKEKSVRIASEKTQDCLKLLKETYQQNPKSLNLQATARKFGLKYDTTKMFKFGSYIEGIGASDNFWSAASGLKEGGFSEIIPAPTGFYIIKAKDRTPVDEKKFEQEKEEFSKGLLSQKRQEYFTKFTEGLMKRAQRD